MRIPVTISAILWLVSAVFPAAAETVTVTVEGCAGLVRHVPDSDVAYKPGVDVDGNEVTPADLPGAAPIKLPEQIDIPITVEIDTRYGIPAVPGLYKPEATIGTVTYRDGRFWFNGQPLQDEAQAELTRACQEQLAKPR